LGFFSELAGALTKKGNTGTIASVQVLIMEDYQIGPKYKDRQEAGALLAKKLLPYQQARPIVLAIPNGGVAVAVSIARELACPLHLMVVRKLQIPDEPEAGFGAVASDGTVLLNEPLVQRFNLSETIIERQKERALKTIRARLARYGPAAEFPQLKGMTAILVDDGLASGFTMEVAVKVVNRQEPKSIIVAAPTSSMSAYRRISPLVDHLLCPDVSRLPIFAVANAYREWRDLEDEEIEELLKI
jgi:putative phosphoribosyl transferase